MSHTFEGDFLYITVADKDGGEGTRYVVEIKPSNLDEDEAEIETKCLHLLSSGWRSHPDDRRVLSWRRQVVSGSMLTPQVTGHPCTRPPCIFQRMGTLRVRQTL